MKYLEYGDQEINYLTARDKVLGNGRRAAKRLAVHDPAAPMLAGFPKGCEIITDRTGPSFRQAQLDLF